MKKKNSAMKKLIPATSMLLVSATMLATSTYAWFTMSKEVEVKGINLTATVPQDVQVSLGNNQSTGTLEATFDNSSTYRLTAVALPGEDDSDPDWSNSVVVGDFYKFGKLTPATSVDGLNMFYTSEATGVGKSLKGQSVSGSTISGPVDNSQFVSATGLTASACAASGTPNALYDNGGAYYIDVPVWFRTSTTSNITLAALATISNQTDASVGFTANSVGSRSNSETADLFKAVRVSILKGEGTTPAGTENTNEQGVLNSSSYGAYYAETATNQRPVIGKGTISSIASTGTWSGVTFATPYTAANLAINDGFASDGTSLITLPASSTTGKNFGPAQRYTIRVWIEGEDENCWNATAGQNFTVSLSFIRQGGSFSSETAVSTSSVSNNTVYALPTSEPVNVAIASAPSGRETLKLIKTTVYGATNTYSWSVANDNAFVLATGEKLTYNTTDYSTLDTLVAAITGGDTPTITYKAPT